MKILVKTNVSNLANTSKAIKQDIDPRLITAIDVAHGIAIEIYANRSQLTSMQKRGQDLLVKLPQGGELLLNNYFQDAAATIKKPLLLVEQDGVFELKLPLETTGGGTETIDMSPAVVPVTHLTAASDLESSVESGAASSLESSAGSTAISPAAVGIAGVAGVGALAVGAAAVLGVAIAAAAGSMAEKATDDMIKAGGEAIDHAADNANAIASKEDVNTSAEDVVPGDGVIGAASDATHGEIPESAMVYPYATETMSQVPEQAPAYV